LPVKRRTLTPAVRADQTGQRLDALLEPFSSAVVDEDLLALAF